MFRYMSPGVFNLQTFLAQSGAQIVCLLIPWYLLRKTAALLIEESLCQQWHLSQRGKHHTNTLFLMFPLHHNIKKGATIAFFVIVIFKDCCQLLRFIQN